jgi:hypothetical protein
MIDDLHPCITHKAPINRCAECWTVFLSRLGVLCATREMGARMWVPRGSLFKPTQREQGVFARALGLR